MVKFFLIALIGTLMAIFCLLPGVGPSATALELPDDLQELLTQAASDLNFPYPGAIEKKSDDLEESPEHSEFDRSRGLTPAVTREPVQAQEAQKAPPVRQHLD